MDAADPVVIHGDRVRLVPPPDIGFAQMTEAWVNDPFTRHLIGGSAYQMSLASREDFVRSRLTPSFDGVYLMIEVIDTPEPVVIGAIELRKITPEHRSAEASILRRRPGLPGARLWHGSDARPLPLRLRGDGPARIHLGVMEFNARAIRSYEQVGFMVEGRLRQDTYLGGHYYDSFVMGLLREDFEVAERAREQAT